MGNTNTELADSCKGADLRRGRRFDAGTGEIELKAWAEKYFIMFYMCRDIPNIIGLVHPCFYITPGIMIKAVKKHERIHLEVVYLC